MNRARLCEVPLAGSWLPWHSCGSPWALFQDAGMLQGWFDPLESWWARKVSTLPVGIETTTPPSPAIWGLFFQLFGGIAQEASSHPHPTGHSARKRVLSRTWPLSTCCLSQLCLLLLAAFGSLALTPPWTCPAAWMPAPAITQGSPGPPHLTCRVSDTSALSALFQAEDKPRPCHSTVVGAKGSLQSGTTALWFSAFYGPPWL